MIITYLGSYGGRGVLGTPWDLVLIAAVALGAYYWGTASALPTGQFDDDAVATAEPAVAVDSSGELPVR